LLFKFYNCIGETDCFVATLLANPLFKGTIFIAIVVLEKGYCERSEAIC